MARDNAGSMQDLTYASDFGIQPYPRDIQSGTSPQAVCQRQGFSFQEALGGLGAPRPDRRTSKEARDDSTVIQFLQNDSALCCTYEFHWSQACKLTFVVHDKLANDAQGETVPIDA